MLKYWLLIIFNTPLVVIGIARAIAAYRRESISRFRFIIWLLFWSLIEVGLVLAEPVYSLLIAHNLTDSPPLSIFGTLSITGVLFSLSLIFRLYSRIDNNERRVAELARQLSIELSEKES